MRRVHPAAHLAIALRSSGTGRSQPVRIDDRPLVEGGPGSSLKRMITQMKSPEGARPGPVPAAVAPKVAVIGNVVRPGAYPLRQEMTVLQALSRAGGFTPFASPRNIKQVRGTGAGQDTRRVNYCKIIDESGEGNYLLRPGDTIVVP